MTQIVTTFNNFSRGQLDHNLMGRFDLPIYTSGAERFKNFISNFKGNAKFRAGLEHIVDAFDCKFVEFRFNKEQNYLCLFYANKIRFLSYDANGNLGWVLSGGSPLEVSTPYSLAHCKEISFAQNADVMYIVHPSHAPRKLTRTGAATFTFTTYSRNADPFTGAGKYPSVIAFYKSRLFMGATNNEITKIWGSQMAFYDDFKIGTNDDDAVEFTIAEATEALEWLSAGTNSLIAGCAQGIISINGGATDKAITPTQIAASLTNSEGSDSTIPLKKDNFLFYLGLNNRRAFYFSYDLLSETFIAKDANFVSYDITKEGVTRLKYKKDKDDLLYMIRGDGNLVSLNFNEDEKIIGWHLFETNGTILDIATITDNDGATQLFCLVNREGTIYVEKLANYVEFPIRDDFHTDDENEDNEAYQRKVAELLKSCNYLDNSVSYNKLQNNSITFNGIDTITATTPIFSIDDIGNKIVYKTDTGYESGTFEITGYTSSTVVTVIVEKAPTINIWTDWYLTFNTITGLSRFNGQTVRVVADGGYLNDFLVSNGSINLGQEVAHIVVGLGYDALIKTFNLGFAFQGQNSQIVAKNLYRAGIRLVHSAGGKLGTTMYSLQDIQLFNPAGMFDLPPMPIDGDEEVSYVGESQDDKFIYIVQDLPLPFEITSLFAQIEYSTPI